MKITKRQLKRIIKEEKMKITKRQLKRIIKEEKMKITKQQLRRLIREEILREVSGPEEEFTEENWAPWLEERGLSVDDLDDLANYVGAPDRSILDAYPPDDGMIGPADIEEWAKDQSAARDILSTRAGSYKGTALPGGKRIK